MAENSKIQWTDHTFNPWIGCTKVSPACDNCYAENMGARLQVKWGPGQSRFRTGKTYWNDPIRWDKKCAQTGTRARVFCASLADVFDNEIPPEWRADLFRLIRATPNLDWLILTKRIGNAPAMIERALTEGHLLTSREPFWPWPNVRIGISVGTQLEASRDIEKMLKLNTKNFISFEPLLERIEVPPELMCQVQWAILGGESGHKARDMNISWLVSLMADCHTYGVKPFVKQLGARCVWDDNHEWRLIIDKKGGDMAEWPTALRVREFPQ
jgi:protein gp37